MKNTKPVLFRETSCNAKLSPVSLEENTTDRLRPVAKAPFCSSTYLPIKQTCPGDCRFKKSKACYALSGFTNRTIRNLEENAKGLTASAIIHAEVEAINGAFEGGDIPNSRDLRLHVSGDVSSNQDAHKLRRAAVRWLQRGGGTVWTYTHAWRTVRSWAWAETRHGLTLGISVLASVETILHLKEARYFGYVPAITLRNLPKDGKLFELDGEKILPCPAESKGTTCVQCRLCLDRLPFLEEKKISIGFGVHGPGKRRVKLLVVNQGELTL